MSQQLQQQQQQQQQQEKHGRGDASASGDSQGRSVATAAGGGARGEGDVQGGGEFVFELGDEGSERSDSFSSLREVDTGANVTAGTAGGGSANGDAESAEGGAAAVVRGEAGGEGAAAAVEVAGLPGGDVARGGHGGLEGAGEVEREVGVTSGVDHESKGNDARVVGSGPGEAKERGVEKIGGGMKDDKRVIVVHCKAGMGRTGLMVSALLMFLEVRHVKVP